MPRSKLKNSKLNRNNTNRVSKLRNKCVGGGSPDGNRRKLSRSRATAIFRKGNRVGPSKPASRSPSPSRPARPASRSPSPTRPASRSPSPTRPAKPASRSSRSSRSPRSLSKIR